MASSAVFTITNDAYALATYVMLRSFLEHNAWFDGDIVVLTDSGLSEESGKHIQEISNRVKIHACDSGKYKKAIEHFKSLGGTFRYWPHMLKFEAFCAEEYERTVFLDSDMLITGDISRLFHNDFPYVICEDRTEDVDFELGLGEREWDGNTYLNSGVFSVLRPKKENFEKLISLAENYDLCGLTMGSCCEQDVINEFLRGEEGVVLFGIEYNAVHGFYADEKGRRLTSEKIVHYFTDMKPWEYVYKEYGYIHGIWRDYLRKLGVVDEKHETVIL